MTGLENLTSVGGQFLITGHDQLASLNGLENLNSVGGMIQIRQNFSLLRDFCALQNLFANGSYNQVDISNNPFNPTVQNIIDGNCSQ